MARLRRFHKVGAFLSGDEQPGLQHARSFSCVATLSPVKRTGYGSIRSGLSRRRLLLRPFPHVRLQSQEVRSWPEPRLDGVSVRSSRRKGSPERSDEVQLLRDGLSRFSKRRLQERGLVRVCSRSFRVLASSRSLPYSAVQRRR